MHLNPRQRFQGNASTLAPQKLAGHFRGHMAFDPERTGLLAASGQQEAEKRARAEETGGLLLL